jgi:hypothetical protein
MTDTKQVQVATYAYVPISACTHKFISKKAERRHPFVFFTFCYVFRAITLSLFHLNGSACVFKTDFWQLYRERSNIIPVHFFPGAHQVISLSRPLVCTP